jgi:hypothetical protein
MESRLIELFLFYLQQIRNTLKQVFLKTQVFRTVDLANPNVILFTNFKG